MPGSFIMINFHYTKKKVLKKDCWESHSQSNSHYFNGFRAEMPWWSVNMACPINVHGMHTLVCPKNLLRCVPWHMSIDNTELCAHRHPPHFLYIWAEWDWRGKCRLHSMKSWPIHRKFLCKSLQLWFHYLTIN